MISKLLRFCCGPCGGSGKVYTPHISHPRVCTECGGVGYVFVEPSKQCAVCAGSGAYLDNGAFWHCLACNRYGYLEKVVG